MVAYCYFPVVWRPLVVRKGVVAPLVVDSILLVVSSFQTSYTTLVPANFDLKNLGMVLANSDPYNLGMVPANSGSFNLGMVTVKHTTHH